MAKMLQRLRTVQRCALSMAGVGPVQPHCNVLVNRFNRKSTLRYRTPLDKKPCFDLSNVTIKRGSDCDALMVKSFLNTYYWPREPAVMGLWMPLDSEYLALLTAKYSYMGERLLAMEKLPRTQEEKMIGITVAERVYPWMISELEQWGHCTEKKPERHHIYFCAHLLKNPNFFQKYKVDYIYDIQVLCTSEAVTGQGVGTSLLKHAIESATQMHHPLVQVVAVSNYASKICEKCGMTQEWTMNYRDFVDLCGQSVFYPRRPHLSVSIYLKYLDPSKPAELPCKPPF